MPKRYLARIISVAREQNHSFKRTFFLESEQAIKPAFVNACIREFKPNGQTTVASPEYGSNGEEPLQFFAAIAKKDIMPSAFFLFSAFPG